MILLLLASCAITDLDALYREASTCGECPEVHERIERIEKRNDEREAMSRGFCPMGAVAVCYGSECSNGEYTCQSASAIRDMME
jgi:hypothetical protein